MSPGYVFSGSIQSSETATFKAYGFDACAMASLPALILKGLARDEPDLQLEAYCLTVKLTITPTQVPADADFYTIHWTTHLGDEVGLYLRGRVEAVRLATLLARAMGTQDLTYHPETGRWNAPLLSPEGSRLAGEMVILPPDLADKV